MKKTLVKSLVLAAVGLMMMVGSALALPVEWGVVNPTDITTATAISAYTDFGYSIWTDDIERTSWHIRWADKTNGLDIFSGTIAMQGNNATYFEFSFEGSDVFNVVDNNAGFTSKITTGVDGIDFTISQFAVPSYVGFDLFRNFVDMDSTKIFLGTQTVNSLGQDQDFAVAAPVPEPATMLLFGTGLAGLAGVARRRKAKK